VRSGDLLGDTSRFPWLLVRIGVDHRAFHIGNRIWSIRRIASSNNSDQVVVVLMAVMTLITLITLITVMTMMIRVFHRME